MAVKRFEYGLILFGLFIFHVFFADYLSFYLFLFFLILPVCSLLLTVVSGQKVQVRMEIPGGKTVRKKAEIPIRLHLKSASRFGRTRVRVRLTVKNELFGTEKKETLLFVMGKAGKTVSYTVASEYCGRLTCRILQVRTYDFLWLFGFSGKYAGREASATVMPDIKRLPLLIGRQRADDWDSDEYSTVRPGDDPGEIFDIREYREGDRISRIHWKLSSKRETLMIKEGGLPVSRRIFLVLDLNGTAGKDGLADSLMDLFASVSWFLMENGIAHKAGWWQNGEGGGHFLTETVEEEAEFYEMLGGVLASGKPSGRQALMESCLEEKNTAEIFYFCTGLSEKEAESLCSSISYRLCVFQMKGGTEEAGRQMAEGLGAEWKVLTPGKEAESLNGFEI